MFVSLHVEYRKWETFSNCSGGIYVDGVSNVVYNGPLP